MKEKLVINRLKIKHAPGFPDDCLRPMEFCEGVNIVYGPNASGKTTTANAIQMLIWPQVDRKDMFITSEMSVGDATGKFTYLGGSRRNDNNVTLPYVGDASCKNRYMLAQHELLSADETGTGFAKMILDEARGGLDIDKTRKDLGYATPATGRRPPELAIAHRDYKGAKDAENGIRGTEQDLKSLEQDIDVSRQAKEEQRKLVLVLDCLEKKRMEESLKSELEKYPQEMAAIIGNEIELLDDVNRSVQRAEEGIREATQRIEEAEAARDKTNLSDLEETNKALYAVKDLCSRIDKTESAIDNENQQIYKIRGEADQAHRNLGGKDVSKYADQLDISLVEKLEGFVLKVESFDAKEQALLSQQRWLSSIAKSQENENRNILQQAALSLYQWLYTTVDRDQAGRKWFNIGILISAIAVIVAIFALVKQTSILSGIAVLFSGITFGIFLKLLAGNRNGSGITRREIEQKFASFNLEAPKQWSQNHVDAMACDLLERVADAELSEKVSNKAREIDMEIESLHTSQQQLDEEKEAISELLGMDISKACGGNHSLLFFVKQLIDWQSKSASVKGMQSKVDNRQNELKKLFEEAHEELKAFGYAPVSGSDELRQSVRALEDRKDGFANANNVLDMEKRNLLNYQTLLADSLQKRIKLLSPFRLEDDPDAAKGTLLQLLKQHESYGGITKKLQEAEFASSEKMREGGQWPDWDRIIALDESELRYQLDNVMQQADRIDDLNIEKGTLENQIRNAKEQAACELALAKLEKITDTLQQRLASSLCSAIGWYLSTEVEKEVTDEQLPDVFTRARELFAEFTSGRYNLKISHNPTDFKAYDNENEAERTLDQLSSATRVQLLMAVRIAFVEEREQEAKLPLLMDETLACSDEYREQAIIEAALNICRNGRQIFYFTSKYSEMAHWLEVAKQNSLPVMTVNLEETPLDKVVHPEDDCRPVLPDPGGVSHAEYGRLLLVPQLDLLSENASNGHIWYVVEEPAHLKTLLEKGFSRCGQICNKHIKEIIDNLIGKETADKARALAKILGDIESLWRLGRGKRLNFEAIQEAGILTTEAFKDSIIALAEELRWDAQALITGLDSGRIKNLRRDKINSFREYCEENGYLVEEIPLPFDDIVQRVTVKATDEIVNGVISAADVNVLCRRVLQPE